MSDIEEQPAVKRTEEEHPRVTLTDAVNAIKNNATEQDMENLELCVIEGEANMHLWMTYVNAAINKLFGHGQAVQEILEQLQQLQGMPVDKRDLN